MTRTPRRPSKGAPNEVAALRAMLLELGLPLTPGSEVTHFGGSIGGEDFEFEVTPDGEIVKSGKKP